MQKELLHCFGQSWFMAFWADMTFPAFLAANLGCQWHLQRKVTQKVDQNFILWKGRTIPAWECFCPVVMLGEITILAECISKVNVLVILWIPWCMHLSSPCGKVELLCPVVPSLTKLCSLFISISGNGWEDVCLAVTSSFPCMLKYLIYSIETFNWTINVLVHILILHYLIYLNQGSWAGFQSHHTSSNPPLFYFHFNKADYLLAACWQLDLSCCPNHCAGLCRCLLLRAGCVAFIRSPWLSPGSGDTCSLECRRLGGPGAMWPLLPGQAGSRLVQWVLWASIVFPESMPDSVSSVRFFISDCKQVGQHLWACGGFQPWEAVALSTLLWGHLSPISAHRPCFEILLLLIFSKQMGTVGQLELRAVEQVWQVEMPETSAFSLCCVCYGWGVSWEASCGLHLFPLDSGWFSDKDDWSSGAVCFHV